MPCSNTEDHDHAACEVREGIAYSMYQYIDTDHVTWMNATSEENGKRVFKPYDERFELEIVYYFTYLLTPKFVESDCDTEMIVRIPFTGCIKLQSIAVFGEPDDESNPLKMSAFVNRDNVGFDDEASAAQSWELVRIQGREVPEYNTR
jgi:PITH domain